MLSLTRCYNALALLVAFVALQAAPVVAQTAPEAPLPSSAPATPSQEPVESITQAPLSLPQLLQLGSVGPIIDPQCAHLIGGDLALQGSPAGARPLRPDGSGVSAEFH